MAPGPYQIILILVVAILVFGGRGRISSIMGDMAKGVRSFRDGLKEEDAPQSPPKSVDSETIVNVTPAERQKTTDTSS